MEKYLWIIVIVAIVIIWTITSWARKTISNSKKYQELKPRLDKLENSIKEHALRVKEHDLKVEKDRAELELTAKKRLDEYSLKVKQEKEALEKLAKEKSMGFPWLADAYAEYYSLKDLKKEKYLENKKHRALSAAALVREIKNEKKLLMRENKIISYKINYFEKLFPWLTDLIATDENEEIPVRMDDGNVDEDNDDRVKSFLTPEEYRKLPSVERNQKALDRYLENRNKSKWHIGRDYEMYVGYLYEQRGYYIEYKGIIDGFDDLGRDIIAAKDAEVCIIQCKHWAQYKEIHEKHIFQLFGTTMEYWIKNFKNYQGPKSIEELAKFLNENRLRPIFFTSTVLSDKAREMASALGVEIIENHPMGDFPRIKCNINYEFGYKTRIYHLPMDQQYDRTIIEKQKGEFYAFTVKEAEDSGFRRAFKHRFQD